MNLFQRLFKNSTAKARENAELQRDIALAGVHEEHPVWLAVLSLADEHAASETAAALSPKLNNEERQYTAGAAATASHFAQMLRDARERAILRMNRERKRDE